MVGGGGNREYKKGKKLRGKKRWRISNREQEQRESEYNSGVKEKYQ